MSGKNFRSKTFEFKVSGKYALFTNPITKMGGEKCSYHIPTYEAIKGILKSIYWKPTIEWVVESIRVVKPIRTASKGIRPINYAGTGTKGNPKSTLSIYTYLADVEYQVKAHFVWNMFQVNMAPDRDKLKHENIIRKAIDKGGRYDVFLGARECQAYVEPCAFGEGEGFYDKIDEMAYHLMFHGFDYPDSIGEPKLYSRFWRPKMKNGVINFIRPENCKERKFIRNMKMKLFEMRGV